MDDSLCGKFDYLRKHLPDELNKEAELGLEKISNFDKYCPGKNCNSKLEKITIGFLWLLGQYFTISQNRSCDQNNTNAFFLYMISWFSYKLKQSSENKCTKIYDFYIKHVNDNDKYKKFRDDSSKFTNLKEFIDEKKNLLNINIEDLYKFYDAFKSLCIIYSNDAKSQKSDILSNNANDFVKKYTELNNKYNNEGTPHSQILSALSTDYNKLKSKYNDFPSIPETSPNSFALTSEDTSSSSIGNRLFTVLSIFGAIAFFLGISYKYSLFGFRKRFQKQKLREKLKNVKKKMNR
ncbi:PIR protein [Plasmodium yoelii]|uniref:PIR protein n=2 Tax=Plasmodium yoelii TaxID=5861 RepID=A0AAE9WQS9_PLAYO|nr:PIR protein [Plasmodium yoelii]WBY57020.1 PIR protein [Plasmodium yoelii yoelii]CDS44973.1 YIR protein [Plasmodium yoelii]VTZ77904.1 PIR protein [Plasmodium yoelii]|eukprot:XP_022811035.1 PIR protein [Plasmodium yoelii]